MHKKGAFGSIWRDKLTKQWLIGVINSFFVFFQLFLQKLLHFLLLSAIMIYVFYGNGNSFGFPTPKTALFFSPKQEKANEFLLILFCAKVPHLTQGGMFFFGCYNSVVFSEARK